MADESQTAPLAFVCEGGLIKSRSTFIMQPGQALELLNFEPDIEGGYKRINGFQKFINHIVPQTSSSTEKVLMVSTGRTSRARVPHPALSCHFPARASLGSAPPEPPSRPARASLGSTPPEPPKSAHVGSFSASQVQHAAPKAPTWRQDRPRWFQLDPKIA